ncbi:MAG: DUF1963 domain-containing protein [Flavobacterium sp.]
MYNKTFEIIKFYAHKHQYIPTSIGIEDWMPDHYILHTDIDIPLGQSRYGGPVIDLPKGIEHPENLRYAGQIDLAKFSPFDKTGLLPKTGQLIFFADIMTDTGKVIYADVANDELVRHIVEHEDNFYSGVLIDKVEAGTESFSERYRAPEDEDEEDDADEDGLFYDYFAGTETSKIFGMFTHCQLGKDEILEVINSDKIVLWQVGENDFNDEGVFSILIKEEDLKKRNFDNCEYYWGQS